MVDVAQLLLGSLDRNTITLPAKGFAAELAAAAAPRRKTGRSPNRTRTQGGRICSGTATPTAPTAPAAPAAPAKGTGPRCRGRSDRRQRRRSQPLGPPRPLRPLRPPRPLRPLGPPRPLRLPRSAREGAWASATRPSARVPRNRRPPLRVAPTAPAAPAPTAPTAPAAPTAPTTWPRLTPQ